MSADAQTGARVLLLSGGLDSTAVAAWQRPDVCLFVDYGQRSASAEATACTAVTRALGLTLDTLTIDCSAIGAGLLHSENPAPGAPSPEWWPFRNQLLITFAAAYAVTRQLQHVLVGTVATDAERHADGTAEFYEQVGSLTRMQEGAVQVTAPAHHLRSEELLAVSGVRDSLLAWTVSCHTSASPCGTCPGCHKRARVLHATGSGAA